MLRAVETDGSSSTVLPIMSPFPQDYYESAPLDRSSVPSGPDFAVKVYVSCSADHQDMLHMRRVLSILKCSSKGSWKC